nr:immunoglobulin heavy chain junction region [Macaca mulatta]
CSVGDHWFDIW